MKKVLLIGLFLSILSCNTHVRQSSILLRFVTQYKEDEFKETKKAVLKGKMIGTVENRPSLLAFVKISKQVGSNQQQDLKIEFDLETKSLVEKEFYFQIDEHKYRFLFDSIQYLGGEVVEKETIIDSDGNSTTSNSFHHDKSVNLLFSIPDAIKNKIVEAKLFVIRFYMDELPYEFTFHEHPKYTMEKEKFRSGSYTYYNEYVSLATSKQRPIELLLLKEILKVKSEEEYKDFQVKYFGYRN